MSCEPVLNRDINVTTHLSAYCFALFLLFLFVCVEVLRPSQQLRSCRAGLLPINTVPGQA